MLAEASNEAAAGLRAFRDRLRILDSIDFDELARHSVIDDLVVWQAFRRDPFRWLIRADDERAERSWQLVEGRTNAAPALWRLSAVTVVLEGPSQPGATTLINDPREPLLLLIRAASPDDYAVTRATVAVAFGRADEPLFLDDLRADTCLIGEWLAEDASGVVGHIAFSRVHVALPDCQLLPAAILTPLAVRPDRQGCGIGLRLIRHALDELRSTGEALFFVLGHPSYYPKVGFDPTLAARIESPWPDEPAFMALGNIPPKGNVVLPTVIAEAH